MSGIFGIWRFDGRPLDPETLRNMSDALAARGPDGAGVWTEESVGLGHRPFHTTPESFFERQPLRADRGSLILSADARIDNREELMRTLPHLPASGATDADLILAAYARWGEGCAARLVGDFTFVVWDGGARKMICVQDRVGTRPLYYHHVAGRLFAFASEINALLTLPEVSAVLDSRMIAHHLLAPVNPELDATYYRAVRRVLPTHCMTVDEREIKQDRYWKVETLTPLVLNSDQEYADALRESLTEAVRSRLRATAPVACTLSGGLDSCSIVGIADRWREELGARLQTLSGLYPRVPECDERDYIELMLSRVCATPYFYDADSISPLADFDQICRHAGAPNSRHHLYLLYHLQREAAWAGSRVVLHGFAGDTVLSGGSGYARELAYQGHWGKLAGLMLPFVRTQGVRYAVGGYWFWMNHYLIHPAVRRVIPSRFARMRGRGAPGKGEPLWRLVMNPAFDEWQVDLPAPPRSRPTSARAAHRERFVDRYLLEALDWGSHVATAAGVEWRVPFLDSRVVELGLRIPPERSVRHGWMRYPLRNAMRGILPDGIRWRPSKSNVYPGWRYAMQTHAGPEIQAAVEDPPANAAQFLDLGRVRTLAGRFLAGRSSPSHEAALWRALTLIHWLGSTESGWGKD